MPGTVPVSIFPSYLYEIAKIALIFLVIIVLGYWIIPMLLFRVAKERSHELFLFTIAGICIIIAWLTNEAGLSVTMGAFIAGLIIGESDYNIDALGTSFPSGTSLPPSFSSRSGCS